MLAGKEVTLIPGQKVPVIFSSFLVQRHRDFDVPCLNVTTSRRYIKKENTHYTYIFLSFAMHLGNATIIMMPPVHLYHSGFLTSENLNSLFLLHVFQPVLTPTNTIHFAH